MNPDPLRRIDLSSASFVFAFLFQVVFS
jgi:hypothetical protein